MSRALTALLLVLAAKAAAAAPAAAPGALAAIDGCISRLDANLDVGYDKVAARCPDLAPSLVHSPFGPWLPSDWDKAGNNLSARGLRQLRGLLVTESMRPAAAAAPDVRHVAAALAALTSAEPVQRGWWQRFKAWLRDLLNVPDAPAKRGWLAQLVEALRGHGGWVRLLSLAALGLVALLAGAIVVRELQAAGLLRWRRRLAPAGAPSDVTAAQTHGWRRIEAASPEERPRLLLEIISARLAAQERLPPARALTVHELLRAARLQDATDRGRLAELAAACERLRFSGRLLPAEALTGALARGRELLDGLDAARA
jgi:hypothetical protein